MLKNHLKSILLFLLFLNHFTSYSLSHRSDSPKHDEQECPICCDRIADTKLNCNHKMCHRCTVKIYETSAKCPFCRADIESYGPSDSDSDADTQQSDNQSSEESDHSEKVERCFSNIRHGHIDRVFECFVTMDVNERDGYGNTPLIVASQNGMIRIVKHLLRLGANINAKNSSGQTALHYTSMYGYRRLHDYLVRKGANYRIRNNYGETCYDVEKSSYESSDRSSG